MGSFTANISKFVENSIVKQNKIVSDIVDDICGSVIELSPVDTGNFISNWLLGVDTLYTGVNSNKNPDKGQELNRLVRKIPSDASMHNYNLSNNSDYAVKLETGQGMLTPAYAMVGITEVRFPGIIRRIIKANGII